eukprot:g13527.t1
MRKVGLLLGGLLLSFVAPYCTAVNDLSNNDTPRRNGESLDAIDSVYDARTSLSAEGSMPTLQVELDDNGDRVPSKTHTTDNIHRTHSTFGPTTAPATAPPTMAGGAETSDETVVVVVSPGAEHTESSDGDDDTVVYSRTLLKRGCFYLGKDNAELWRRNTPVMPGLTREMCSWTCLDDNMLPGLLMFGGQSCVCLHDADLEKAFQESSRAELCHAPCAGDPLNYCGGFEAYEILLIVEEEYYETYYYKFGVGESTPLEDDDEENFEDAYYDHVGVGESTPLQEQDEYDADEGDDESVFGASTPLEEEQQDSIEDEGSNNDEFVFGASTPLEEEQEEEASYNTDGELATAKVYMPSYWGWSLGELSFNSNGLRYCGIEGGETTSSCQEFPLDGSSEAVVLEEDKWKTEEEGRFSVRVMTGAPRGKKNRMWVLGMQTRDELQQVMNSIRIVIGQSPAVEDNEMAQRMIVRTPNDKFLFERTLGPDTIQPIPAFRGDTLSPQDAPLKTGQFLSTLPALSSVNVEVTEVGDVILRRGDLPAYPSPVESDPEDGVLWAHRATGSVGGRANGGLGCVLESLWRRFIVGVDDVPVNLSVKDGRWRIGRGTFCTMGASSTPAGRWRVYLPHWTPGNAWGKALRAASLQLLPNGNLVVAAGSRVFWESSTSK